jgi:hypothetical protein
MIIAESPENFGGREHALNANAVVATSTLLVHNLINSGKTRTVLFRRLWPQLA